MKKDEVRYLVVTDTDGFRGYDRGYRIQRVFVYGPTEDKEAYVVMWDTGNYLCRAKEEHLHTTFEAAAALAVALINQ